MACVGGREPNVFLDDVIGVPPAKEGAEQVARARREIEETGLQRGGQVEARVEDVADRREEGVHIPDKGGGCDTDENAMETAAGDGVSFAVLLWMRPAAAMVIFAWR